MVGLGAVERVEVSVDGGDAGRRPTRADDLGRVGVARLAFAWERGAGRARALLPRARRGRERAAARAGVEPRRLRNNAVQRVPVTVDGG